MTGPATATSAAPVRFEYRVTWRRSGWSSRAHSKSKLVARRADLDAFLSKLRGTARPELSPLIVLRVDRRPVGDWEPVS